MSARLNNQPQTAWSRRLLGGCVLALVAMLLFGLNSASKRELPLTAFSVSGYTSNGLFGWQAVVHVSNALPFEIQCGACSGLTDLAPDGKATQQHPWHRLNSKVPVTLLDEGLKPVVAPIPWCGDGRDLYVRYHEVQVRTIPAHQSEQFLVGVERTNHTRVVVFYGSAKLSPIQKLRLWINASFDRMMIRESPRRKAMVTRVLDLPDSHDRVPPEPGQ